LVKFAFFKPEILTFKLASFFGGPLCIYILLRHQGRETPTISAQTDKSKSKKWN